MSEEKKIISRKEAQSLGLKRYFTGKPCKYGHVDERFVSTCKCMECCRIQSKEYGRSNPDKIADKNRKFRNDNPDYFAQYNAWYQKDYYERNRDEIILKSRKYYNDNKDIISERSKKYYSENLHVYAASRARRRDACLKAEGVHTAEDISIMLDRQKNRCAEPTCGVDLSDGYHVDHIMPLSKGGSNWPSNLQCLCPTCNLRKHAKHPIDWARENGRLL